MMTKQMLKESEKEGQKLLFMPLKTEYFNAFRSGEKNEELRRYGQRWNEVSCPVGRRVTISHGYQKAGRLHGTIWKFKRQWGSTFGSTYQEALRRCYGTTELWVACVSITIDNAEATGGLNG